MLKVIGFVFIVPAVTLFVLMALIWLKGTGNKRKVTVVWGCLYLFLTICLASLAATQYVNGCGFSLGDCYAEGLPEGFFGLKLLAVMGYYLWMFAAALSIVRRSMGGFDSIARKLAWGIFAMTMLLLAYSFWLSAGVKA